MKSIYRLFREKYARINPPAAKPIETNQIIGVLPLEVVDSTRAVGLVASMVKVGEGDRVGGTTVAVRVAVAGPGVGVSVAGGVTCKTSF